MHSDSCFWGRWSPESSSADNLQVADVKLSIGLRWGQPASEGCFSKAAPKEGQQN